MALISGLIIIEMNKASHPETRFTHYHGVMGLITYILVLLQALIGFSQFYIPNQVFGSVAKRESDLQIPSNERICHIGDGASYDLCGYSDNLQCRCAAHQVVGCHCCWHIGISGYYSADQEEQDGLGTVVLEYDSGTLGSPYFTIMSGHLFALFRSKVWYGWRTRAAFAIGIRSMMAAPSMLLAIVVVGMILRPLERAPSEFQLASPTLAGRKPQTLPLAKKASLELDETDTLYSIRLHSF